MIYRAMTPLLLVFLVTACGNQGPVEITDVRTVKRDDIVVKPGATPNERFAMRPIGAPATDAGTKATTGASDIPLRWDTPKGWLAKPSTEMRIANLGLESNPDVECYLSVLPGPAGGVVDNINRWRKQMSQAPLSEQEISALPTLPMLNLTATKIVIDGTFTGMSGSENKMDYRLIGAILKAGDNSLFVKMIGPKAAVEPQESNFDAFCKSLHVTSGHSEHDGHNHDTPPASESAPPEAAPTAETSAWTAPASWTLDANRPMREVSYKLGPDKKTECYLTVLAGDGGGILANVNRWYGQMGEPAITDSDMAALPKITLYGQPASLVEVSGTFTSMQGEKMSGYKMLGALAKRGNSMVFVKMVGPEADVTAEKANFTAFCESLQ
jgi:hypothetical protein